MYLNQLKMFRQILLIIVFLGNTFCLLGNSKADALRKNMHEAPDSVKAAILVNIAKLFQYEREDSCIFYARKASDMARRTRQELALVDAETLLSQIALEKKNYGGAIDHQRVILQATIRMRNWDMVMESYNAIAQTWLLRNNYAEAVEYLKKGVEIAVERNNLELSKYFYQALIDSYRRLRNMDAVCLYYSMLIDVNQKLDAETTINLTNALTSQRDSLISTIGNMKDHGQQQSTTSKVINIIAVVLAFLAIASLAAAFLWFRYEFYPGVVKTKKDLDDKSHELDSLRKNQESAFRFLTSHVYTSINSLAENISLFEAEQGDLPVGANSTINRINGDIFALYGFFQNFTLLLQAQSGQLTPALTTVNIPQLANNLLADYEDFAMAKDILLINEVQNNTFATADERLVDIVLRNMMTNAFKYAPAGNGRITVGTKVGTKVETKEGIVEDTGFVEVWVTDDGIGLDVEQADLLFELSENLSLPGDPNTKGYGVGLAVCKAVIELFKGRIWAETKPEEGFCIRFSLPRAKDTEVKTMSLSLIENTQDNFD